MARLVLAVGEHLVPAVAHAVPEHCRADLDDMIIDIVANLEADGRQEIAVQRYAAETLVKHQSARLTFHDTIESAFVWDTDQRVQALHANLSARGDGILFRVEE